MYTHISCPVCKLENSLSFYEGTENGAPHASGFWPMQVRDVDQLCVCELTDEQWLAAETAAWAPLQAQADADAKAEAEYFANLYVPCPGCGMRFNTDQYDWVCPDYPNCRAIQDGQLTA